MLVAVWGDAGGVRQDLEGQIGVDLRVEETTAADWPQLVLAGGGEDFVLLAEPGLRLAPDALAVGVARLRDAPDAALAWFHGGEETAPRIGAALGDVARDLILALAAGEAGGRGHFLLRRRSLLGLPLNGADGGEDRVARTLLRLVARSPVVAVAAEKVRRTDRGAALTFPEVGLRAIEEDLFFVLGGGRQASLHARAQVRRMLAESTAREGLRGEQAERWIDEAAVLFGGRGPGSVVSCLPEPTPPDRAALLARGVAWPPPQTQAVPEPIDGWTDPGTNARAESPRLADLRAERAAMRAAFEREAMHMSLLRCEIDSLRAQAVRPAGSVGEPCLPADAAALPEPPLRARGEEPGGGGVLSEPPGRAGGAASGGGAALRLVLVVPELEGGGLESVVRDQADALPGYGAEVLVVVERGGGRMEQEMRARGVRVVSLGSREPAADFGRILDEFRPDLVVAHYSLVAGAPAAARAIPAVVVLHNEYSWLGAAEHDPMAALDRKVQGYIAVSESVRAFHARRFGVAQGRIAVVRNAPARFPTADIAKDARSRIRAEFGLSGEGAGELLVSVARIEPVKNQILLVEALAALRARGVDARLVLAGAVADTLFATRLERRIAALDLGDVVHCTGLRPDIPELLAGADLFVLPSLFEGLSLAAAEAIAAGLPAVLSPSGDAAWLLDADGAQPAGIVADLPAQDPQAADPGAAIGQAATPSADEAACLSAALADACTRLPALRAGARTRAAALRDFFDPERPVRETFALLLRAAGAVDPATLAASVAWQREENARLLAERDEAWAAARAARAAEIEYFALRNRIRRRLASAWRRLRPA